MASQSGHSRHAHADVAPDERLKFPCGHVEAGRSVAARLRLRGGRAWIACRRCNLIAVVATTTRRARRKR